MAGNVREKTEPTAGSHSASATSAAARGPTLPAKIMAILLAGGRAVSAPLRVPRQRSTDRAGPAAGMHNYKFQAVVAVIPSQDAVMPLGPDRPGPDWRGVIRARSGQGRSHGMFSALVSDWAQGGPLGADAREPHAVATIVVFGPEPAESLPVGGTFALWRGRDVGLGVVTRRVYV